MPETVTADRGIGGSGVVLSVLRFLSLSWWLGVGLRGIDVVSLS